MAPTPKPWEFPTGSAESRAAARAIVDSRDRDTFRLRIVNHIPRPRQDNSRPHIGEWQSMADGFMRIVFVPEATDDATLEKLLAPRPDAPCAALTAPHS
jgi:hypothetical protein